MFSFNVKNRYIVLIAGCIIQLCIGILYMWSVFQPHVSAYFNTSQQGISLTSSIMIGCFVLGIIIGGRAMDKLKPQLVILAGAFLFSLGMLLTSFLSPANPQMIYITYGVISGLGTGINYTSIISVNQRWFPDKKGFATGITVAAFGFSIVLLVPITNMLLNSIGVLQTFRAFSIVFFAICLVCILFIKNPEAVAAKASAAKKDEKNFTPLEIIKTKEYYLITLAFLFATPTYFILNPLFKILGEQRNLSETLALAGVMITGIASTCGRFFSGWLSDKIGCKNTLIGLMVLTLFSSLAMIFVEGIFYLITLAIVAFAFGGYLCVFSVLSANTFGSKNAGANYGLVMLGYGFSALLSPVCSNLLNSGNGDYSGSFILAAAVSIIAMVLIFMTNKNREAKMMKNTAMEMKA